MGYPLQSIMSAPITMGLYFFYSYSLPAIVAMNGEDMPPYGVPENLLIFGVLTARGCRCSEAKDGGLRNS